jgi:hypothetical protein
LNSGCFYGALAALLVVVVKTLKYSGGGGAHDLPWAILIILTAGLIGGVLWHLARAAFAPRTKSKESRSTEDAAPRDGG